MAAKTTPVAMWRTASVVLSGKAKMPAGLVEKAAQTPVEINAPAAATA